jgi:hypothetical protein
MKNNYKKIILGLSIMLAAMLQLQAAVPGAMNCATRTVMPSVAAADSVSWTLIYSDSLVKVYYTDIVCETADAVRLKMVNLTNQELSFTYKIWNASPFAKSVTLQASQELEGICATIYNNLLVEAIPEGSGLNNINVQITY